MKLYLLSLKSITLLFTLFLLAGCGGGDGDDSSGGSSTASYQGKTSAATASDSNYKDLALAGSYGSEMAVTSNNVPSIGGRSLDQTSILPNQLVIQLTKTPSSISRSTRATQDMSAEICDSGSAVANGQGDENSGDFTITFTNCAIDVGDGTTAVYNGVAHSVYSSDGSFTISYQNFTIRYNGTTSSLNMTFSCDSNSNCTSYNDFSEDGVTYRVSDASVYGDSSSGWNVSARVYHENYGYINIQASNLIMCNSGGFSSGSISVTDSTNTEVISIVFDSCSSMTVSYNGNSETVSQ
ncbi:hypothetical protein [Gynuella sunshinyii]|uniref:Lipoprotein n=1 Tax=Gynuella sunshinyii YC6258 TaxID=1445510 RepID=A0A0C5VKV6_9GAMM|nr:hypothetical protein [Gynuella sunshinyii]AJQ94023.1 hypothetical Protein YC6258_01979 [Gynuella sunshinyii YC6258]